MSDDVGSQIYTGAATFGRFSAIIGGIFGTLIGLAFVGIGIYFIVEGSRRKASVTAKITKKECNGDDCQIEVQYTVPGPPSKMCTKTFPITRSQANEFQVGGSVTVFYDPSDPCGSGDLDSRQNSIIIGIILIIVGGILIIIVWVTVWLTQRYKFFAAVEGVSTVVSIL